MRGTAQPQSPPAPANPAANDGYVIGFDVGGTLIKAVAVSRDGAVIHRSRRATNRAAGPGRVVENICAFAASLSRKMELTFGCRPAGLGVAIPGFVDEARGVALRSAHLGWRDVPLRAQLEERTCVRVTLEHDVRAGGLAEWVLGAAVGVSDFLFIPIGTGIAGAMFLAAAPYAGARGVAGEIGHIVVDPTGAPCPCGQIGCLETVASAASIARRYTARAGLVDELDAAEVVRRMHMGDANATAVWGQAADALADALAIYAVLLDPELIVVGGGLAKAGASLLRPLRAGLESRLRACRSPRVARAALGDEAGCRGAAIQAWGVAGLPLESSHRS